MLLAFVVMVPEDNDANRTVAPDQHHLAAFTRKAQHSHRMCTNTHTTFSYTTPRVIEVEWPAMAEGRPGSPEVYAVIDDMSQSLAQLPANTPIQQAYLGASGFPVEPARRLPSGQARLRREGCAQRAVDRPRCGRRGDHRFRHDLRPPQHHAARDHDGQVTPVIGVLLFISISIDHPFDGDVAVTHPLERVISTFHNAP